MESRSPLAERKNRRLRRVPAVADLEIRDEDGRPILDEDGAALKTEPQ